MIHIAKFEPRPKVLLYTLKTCISALRCPIYETGGTKKWPTTNVPHACKDETRLSYNFSYQKIQFFSKLAESIYFTFRCSFANSYTVNIVPTIGILRKKRFAEFGNVPNHREQTRKKTLIKSLSSQNVDHNVRKENVPLLVALG